MSRISTREVMERLGINSTKTLFRRRTDYKDTSCNTQRFLEPNIHFFAKSPGSPQLVWDWEKTSRAWHQALKIDSKGVG